MSYKCSFTDDDETLPVESCELMKGFVINGSSVVQCNGWKRVGCNVSTQRHALK
eukprot:jgi/Orpsp1_1/1182980/evm.model.c7180000083365.2